MRGTLIRIDPVEQSVPPKLRFYIEVENESRNEAVRVFAWGGKVTLREPEIDLGVFEPDISREEFQPLQRTGHYFYWDVVHRKVDLIEAARKGKDLLLEVNLNLLLVSFLATGALALDKLRTERVSVSSPGQDKVVIPKSTWERNLDGLGYGRVEYLELYLPPPPLGAKLGAVLHHLQKAKENFNAGEYSDTLTSCQSAFDELEKLWGKEEEEQRTFVAEILEDKKKAVNYLAVAGQAKNFTGGAAHTPWVKGIDKRDAEFALRLTWAIVGYFARNLARAKG